MSVREPLGAGVVEVGQRAPLEFVGRRFVAGNRALRIAGDGLVHPFHPLRRVEPSVAQLHQPPRRIRDGDGLRIVGIGGGGDVWREPSGEWEGLEGRGRGVARIVALAEPCAQPQRPCLMEPAVQNAEGRVVVAGNNDQLLIGADARITPDKQTVLRNHGGGDVARVLADVVPHLGTRTFVQPPKFPKPLNAVVLSSRQDIFGDMRERRFI